MKLAAARALTTARNRVCVQKPHQPLAYLSKMARNSLRDHEAAVFRAQGAARGQHWQFLIRGRLHHFSDSAGPAGGVGVDPPGVGRPQGRPGSVRPDRVPQSGRANRPTGAAKSHARGRMAGAKAVDYRQG
jgi:hypothetical protein